MSARRFKGYRVGIIKPDGARRYMKPRSDGKWSLSETKPIVLDEDEMSDALDDVGDFMVGGDVSFSTPVFATRKPKPAPAEGAAEAPSEHFVVVHDTAVVNLLEGKPGYARQYKYIGTHAEAVDFRNGRNALTVWRILPDGALEAACEAAYERGKTDALRNVHALGTVEAARREERDRVCADTKKAIEKYVWDHSSVDVTHIYKLLDEAAKGQAK